MKAKLAILISITILFVVSCSNNNVNLIAYKTKPVSPTQMPTQNRMQTPSPPQTASPEPTKAFDIATDPCRIKIEDISIPKSDVNHLSSSAIAEKLFDQMLKKYTICQPPSLWKIDDYKILQVRAYTKKPPVMVGITYSIKPSQDRTWFAAGNGIINDENKWIEYKYVCYELVAGKTEYYLTGGWTMC